MLVNFTFSLKILDLPVMVTRYQRDLHIMNSKTYCVGRVA